MKTIRLGIVGAGDHLKSHITGLTGLDDIVDVKVSAIVDPQVKKVDDLLDQRHKKDHSIVQPLIEEAIIYPSEDEMYKHAGVDAVMVGTPDRFHLENLKKTVDNGVHAMVEKPLLTGISELEDLANYLQKAEDKELILTSCHLRRFDPPFIFLKEKLEELTSKFGRVLNVNYDFSYPQLKEKGIHKGLLIDHFNHEIDILNFLFGYQDFSATRFYDTEERYSAGGIRNDGIAFNFHGSRFLESRNYPESIELRFERGLVKLYTKDGTMLVEDFDISEIGFEQARPVDYVNRLRGVNKNFIEAILGVTPNYLTKKELYVNNASGVYLTEKGEYNSQNDDIFKKLQLGMK